MLADIYNKNGKAHRSKKIIKGECIFPFKYKRKLHTKCLDTGNGPWCPTKIKSNKTIDTWGYCISSEIINAVDALTRIKANKTSKNLKKNKKVIKFAY